MSAAVRKMQEEVEARQMAEAEAARLAEEQRIRVCAPLAVKACRAAELCVLAQCLDVISMAACVTLPLHVVRCLAGHCSACVTCHSLCCTAQHSKPGPVQCASAVVTWGSKGI